MAAEPRTFDEYCSAPHFHALDGLRGLSILLVLLHHGARFDSAILRTLQENGRHGVSFFFVISGFLICTLLLREQRKNGAIALGKFFQRRAARLLPLYYAVLAGYVVMVYGMNVFSAQGEELFRQKLPSYLFYYSNWLATSTDGPFFFAWSLAVEEQFYIGFALSLFFLRARIVIGVVTAALLLKFAVYQFVGPVDVGSTLWRIVFSYQEPILLGVLLAFALSCRPIYDRVAHALGHRWLMPGIGALLAVRLLTHPITSQSTWDAQLLFVLMTATVAACVVRPRVPVLGGGLVAHIGKVSYGIYLLHWWVIVAVYRALPGGTWNALWHLLLTTAIVVAMASLVHRYFEAPIIQYFKRRQMQSDTRLRAGGTTMPLPAAIQPAVSPVARMGS